MKILPQGTPFLGLGEHSTHAVKRTGFSECSSLFGTRGIFCFPPSVCSCGMHVHEMYMQVIFHAELRPRTAGQVGAQVIAEETLCGCPAVQFRTKQLSPSLAASETHLIMSQEVLSSCSLRGALVLTWQPASHSSGRSKCLSVVRQTFAAGMLGMTR